MAPIICIGSVLWDIIGRHPESQPVGFDKGGKITMLAGGVAMNIAMALRALKQEVVLLSYLGKDSAGDALLKQANAQGMNTAHIDRADLPTDRYMAIEAGGDLFGAIADAHSLEHREGNVIAPLLDGRLGDATTPFDGQIVLDGNLTETTLAMMATHAAFARADMRLAPASPGKVLRLRAFLAHPRTTLYANLQEANALLQAEYTDSLDAAKALFGAGLARAVITDGANACALCANDTICTITPPAVMVKRITGAGDYFMAAHIAAERRNLCTQDALAQASNQTANYITTEHNSL